MSDYSPQELSLLKDAFIRDAEGLFQSMASECPTCHIPKSRCPECWCHTAKLYLRKLDNIRAVRDRLAGIERPRPAGAEPTNREERIIAIVAVLRAAGRPVPASDILVRMHPKSLLRLLSIATARGLLRRTRKPDPRTHRTVYFYTPAKP